MTEIDNHSHLLLNGVQPIRGNPGTAMYVCICNGITDSQILEAAANGCRSVSELTMRTGCGASCGSCLETAAAMLEPLPGESASLLPMLDLSRAA